ncbi:MAG: GMC family oxidoreductase [Gluconobacter sp.]
MKEATYDVIVVGSGAAGSFAAKELAEQGLSVLVLEAGQRLKQSDVEPRAGRNWAHTALFPRVKATLLGQPIQARVAFFKEQLRHLFVNDWAHGYTTPKGRPFLWIRGKQTGGRLHVFGRVLFRWSDTDFKGRSSGTGTEDWPLSYADLIPFYEKVERFLGICGNNDGVNTAPDGIMAEPAILTPEERGFRAAVKARWTDRHTVAWRFNRYNSSPLPAALDAALATGRTTLQSEAIVERIETDPVSGKATGVTFIHRRTRKCRTVTAKAVVVCASPIESVRLLLNSRSSRHPSGLGNSSDVLGRYFMDQCANLMFGRWPATVREGLPETLPQHPLFGPTGGIYVPRYANIGNHRDAPFSGGYTYQGSIGRYAGPDAQGYLPVTLMGFGEMLPYEDNRITLNSSRKDRWGIPLPHISCGLHSNERAMLERQIQDSADMIESGGGLVDFWASPLGLGQKGAGMYPDQPWPIRWFMRKMFSKSLIMGAAIHESGGARMGTDPATSYLNSYGQCWEVPNVYVTDASSFPTGGSLGTTLTVMALSTRACEHLATELKAGRL